MTNHKILWTRLKVELEMMTDDLMDDIRRNHEGSVLYSAKLEYALKQLIRIRALMKELEKERAD